MASHLKPSVSDQDHVQGSPDASITLVEYGDFECPHCGAAYPIIKKMQLVFGEQLRFVYRNFPLSESHPHAKPAAIAAEAAALEGRYWEMHDAIFENQDALDEDGLLQLADDIGLSLEKFKEDLQNPELDAKVEADFESGIRSGVNGTPCFFINGQKFDGGAEDVYNLLKE